MPDFSYEKHEWRRGFTHIAGVDEVGRGCFAGPVVTGCVIFSKDLVIPTSIIINDSKQVAPKRRENADIWIRENALSWGIGEIGASKINKYGMAKATKMAFRKSISEARKRLGKPIDFLLADAFFVPFVPGLPAKRRKNKKGRFYKKAGGRQMAITKGDTKSFSIAAASIIAKVYRDKLMLKLSKNPKYRKYGWGRNKGYGTKEHQNAIKRYGISRQHRKAFVETFLNNSSSSQAQ
jgi:ribonuclease HII